MCAQERAETLAEGRFLGTLEVNLAVEGHEQLHGLYPLIVRGDQDTVMDQLVGQVFDGMAEYFEGMAGRRVDVAPAGSANGGN